METRERKAAELEPGDVLLGWDLTPCAVVLETPRTGAEVIGDASTAADHWFVWRKSFLPLFPEVREFEQFQIYPPDGTAMVAADPSSLLPTVDVMEVAQWAVSGVIPSRIAGISGPVRTSSDGKAARIHLTNTYGVSLSQGGNRGYDGVNGIEAIQFRTLAEFREDTEQKLHWTGGVVRNMDAGKVARMLRELDKR